MQSRVFRIMAILGLLAASATGTQGQRSAYRLYTADSLFKVKQFTQSLQHYEAILANNEFTPAMLLKMAYVHEGLDHPGKTLYYLNLYHQSTGDSGALRKMEELATKYNLGGYTITDADRLLAWYLESREYITVGLAAACVLLLALAFRTRFRKKKRPAGAFAAITFLVAVLFVHLNFGDKLDLGIIAEANTFIMSGPSPGSNVIERVGEGHRIEILGKKDVWLKVRWNGEMAYVKERNVLTVN